MVNSILKIEDDELNTWLFGFLPQLHGCKPTHRGKYDGKEEPQEKQSKIHRL